MTTLENTTETELEKAKQDLEKALLNVRGLEAQLYLENLEKTATYFNAYLKINDPTRSFKLFNIDEIVGYRSAESNDVLYNIKFKVRYFKDMDDSKTFPEWKKEAYKMAKIYQEWYNAKYKN